MTTFSLQPSLPKLPLPEIEDTLALYLETLKPLLNDDEFQTVVKNAEDFRKSQLAVDLQKLLVEKKKKTDKGNCSHWLSDW